MKKYVTWAKLVVLLTLYACNSEERNSVDPVRTMTSDFQSGVEGWAGDYALYNLADTTKVAFSMERDSLPSDIDSLRWSLRLGGTNVGDSIFLFLKKEIAGLNPEKTYNVSFDINLATNFPDLPGATGTTISLKAGASDTEPAKKLAGNYYNFSLNKGRWNEDGAEMVIIGNLVNNSARAQYQLVNRNNGSKTISVKPDVNGKIWVCIGEDTRYKGRTVIYYDMIKVIVKEQ